MPITPRSLSPVNAEISIDDGPVRVATGSIGYAHRVLDLSAAGQKVVAARRPTTGAAHGMNQRLLEGFVDFLPQTAHMDIDSKGRSGVACALGALFGSDRLAPALAARDG